MERWSASRRRVLRSGSVLAAIGAAGCVGDESDRETDAGDGDETEESGVDEPAVAAELTPESGESGDRFGTAITLDGGAALVGAPGDADAAGYRVGATYGFERSGDDWSRRRAPAPDRDGADVEFGAAVALDGDTALVGAPVDDGSGGFESGSAYAFEWADGDWRRQATLTPDDGGPGGWFGTAVALDGTTALAGAPGDGPGVAYAFERADGDWRRQATLEPQGSESDDRFGTAVALDGATAIVGAPGDGPGVAYAFERTDGTWRRRAAFEPEDADSADRFGAAVAVAGDVVLVGAPRRDFAAGGAGAAYVFERSGEDWRGRVILEPDGDERGFGAAVAVGDGTAIVGAPNSNADPDGTGTANAYERRDGAWRRRANLAPEDADSADGFGTAVALDGTTALVGDDARGPGAAYAFEL
ncbi:FG-GAP repeat protein [Natrinema salifodinae]|uniref:FG-GAP repeat-containing protein n=1 Tax=Natrinema salifodinae TaxID=1202768 RepID=A0A1I0PEK6_9EURY|nr:FG-GAP repeat protein [Natrinema salifodinae]SEW12668.1 FG-GAP repeat-containing protein [Natrinema salifodinae]